MDPTCFKETAFEPFAFGRDCKTDSSPFEDFKETECRIRPLLENREA